MHTLYGLYDELCVVFNCDFYFVSQMARGMNKFISDLMPIINRHQHDGKTVAVVIDFLGNTRRRFLSRVTPKDLIVRSNSRWFKWFNCVNV